MAVTMRAKVIGGSRTKTMRMAVAPPMVRPLQRVSQRSVSVHSAATDEIIEKLKGISLLEASELVKQIEETFGVDASAPAGGMMMAAPGGAAPGAVEEAEEQTEFDLTITEVDAAKKIASIKVVRQLTTLGLKEAKDAVTSLPFKLLEGTTKEEAEEAKAKLEETGCKCEIK